MTKRPKQAPYRPKREKTPLGLQPSRPLTAAEFARARRILMRRDPRLAVVIKRAGPCLLPTARTRAPFASLVRAIMSQQLSGKAVDTIYGRVLNLVGGPTGLSAAAGCPGRSWEAAYPDPCVP